MLRDHAQFHAIQSVGRSTRNPFVDQLGPQILYVRMVSLLDDGLTISLGTHGIHLSGWPTLDRRIKALAEAGLLRDDAVLHQARKRRNAVAHEPNPPVLSWDDLQNDTQCVHKELQHLGLVGEIERFRTFITRDVDLDPGPGLALRHDFRFGVLDEANVERASYEWSVGYYRSRLERRASSRGLGSRRARTVGHGGLSEARDSATAMPALRTPIRLRRPTSRRAAV